MAKKEFVKFQASLRYIVKSCHKTDSIKYKKKKTPKLDTFWHQPMLLSLPFRSSCSNCELWSHMMLLNVGAYDKLDNDRNLWNAHSPRISSKANSYYISSNCVSSHPCCALHLGRASETQHAFTLHASHWVMAGNTGSHYLLMFAMNYSILLNIQFICTYENTVF